MVSRIRSSRQRVLQIADASFLLDRDSQSVTVPPFGLVFTGFSNLFDH